MALEGIPMDSSDRALGKLSERVYNRSNGVKRPCQSCPRAGHCFRRQVDLKEIEDAGAAAHPPAFP